MSKASNVLLCVGLLALLAIPATALSQGGIQSGWTDSPPTLNGKIGAGEWSDATRVSLHSTGVSEDSLSSALGIESAGLTVGEEISPQQATGWLYLMNDARYLYLAATLDIGAPAGDPDYWDTMFYFVFEDEPTVGDGKWAADLCSQNPDEGVYMSRSGYFPGHDYDYDTFLPASEANGCFPWQFDPVGYNRALGWGSANWEARFDLRASALDVAPGDCFNLGLLLMSVEFYFEEEWYGRGEGVWPAGLLGIDEEPDWPDVFGLVCLAEEPVEEEEFVPEAGTLALLGTGLAGLGGYATLRWRSRGRK